MLFVVVYPPGMNADLEARLAAALDAARGAGSIALDYFSRSGLEIERKTDGSPVTIADRHAETHLRQCIRNAFEDDAIEGEEHGKTVGDSGFTWILDPIDGTISFVHGVPLFGTLIGVEYQGQHVLGVIHMPALDETAWATIGSGAWHQTGSGEPVRASVSPCQDLNEAMVLTTSYDYFRDTGTSRVLERIYESAGQTRGWSDCYASLLVATGRADAAVEPLVHPWDIAALFPIIREAGGEATDWSGVPSIRNRNAILSNGRVHGSLLKLTGNTGSH